MKYSIVFILLMSIFTFPIAAYEEAFTRTDKGTIEIKSIPQMHMIEATSEKGYFDADNQMFRKLFRYISSNDIAMTTPVTVDVTPGAMRFVIGNDDQDKAQKSTSDVSVIQVPERTVASIGYNGSYNQKNYKKHLKLLQSWLKERESEWTITGEPIAVYWDGPFKLPGWKKAEILIPVKPAQ